MKSNKTLWLERKFETLSFTESTFRDNVRKARAGQLVEILTNGGTLTNEDREDLIKLLAGVEL